MSKILAASIAMASLFGTLAACSGAESDPPANESITSAVSAGAIQCNPRENGCREPDRCVELGPDRDKRWVCVGDRCGDGRECGPGYGCFFHHCVALERDREREGDRERDRELPPTTDPPTTDPAPPTTDPDRRREG